MEPDNVDGYQADTGFALTEEDQVQYLRWLAAEAHARGLTIGLKNSPALVAAVLDDFDWAMTEGCFAQGWCEEMSPFIEAGKPVFAAEYTDTDVDFAAACEAAPDLNFSFILKERDLGAWVEFCP